MRKRGKAFIQNMRMDLGKYLHTYYVKFGEEKYDVFLDKLGATMSRDYGEPFNAENLRIMEAEYVTFAKKIKHDDADDRKSNRVAL